MRSRFRLSIITIFFLGFISIEIAAQSSASFQVASRLIQQQRYEEALPILKSLHQQEPQVFVFLDRLVECHVQLKEYDDARLLIENSIDAGLNVGYSNVILGKLYHLEGDTETALEVWERNLEQFPNLMQLYYNTANIMTERREFDSAIQVFQQARIVFNNNDLFLMDIPNVYMQAGQYQEAIAEWLQLIDRIPEQSNVFKRNLIRYNDPLLFEDSIAEIEFKLREMSVTDANYRTFFDLQNWLLFENNLFRRAYAAALRYEMSTLSFNYTLDLVGRQLVENNEFELASQAFAYYRDNAQNEVKLMAYEKMADVKSRWAKYLQDYNLDEGNKANDLYKHSIELLDTLINEYNYYRRIDQIYLRKAELSLDHVYDLDEAKQAVNMFKMMPGKAESAQGHYLNGRIHLAQDEFTLARIEFTRSNRIAGTGDLAEKTRYFLALTDFYAGDFEFAQIQLKTLGRRNTSYYANDALKLRLWLQEGTAMDTTGTQMSIFANNMKELLTDSENFDENILLDYVDDFPNSSFKDDVLLAIAENTSLDNPRFINYLNSFLNSNSPTPLRENLLWVRALLSESTGNWIIGFESNNESETSTEDCFFNNDCGNDVITITTRELFEELILEYPDGFYAPYARQKLIQLPS